MKATGIVRRIDDLGRVVIPKEIRRTMRIREGDPSLITLTWYKAFTGKDISGDSFDEFDEPVTAEERAAVIKAVNAAFED